MDESLTWKAAKAQLAAERQDVMPQYFGDVNDFRKYGLLRAFASAGLSIGVCWLLTADDAGGDGELRGYLSKPSRWRRYDADLYDRLQQLQQPGVQRRVKYASTWGLVPGATYIWPAVRQAV